MRAEAVVQRQDVALGDSQCRTVVVVVGVRIWDDGIEVVVAAAKLQHNNYWVFLAGSHGLSLRRYKSSCCIFWNLEFRHFDKLSEGSESDTFNLGMSARANEIWPFLETPSTDVSKTGTPWWQR